MAITKTKAGKRLKVSPGTKGAISEHVATAWLLQQGYDVFRNVSPNGRADLLAVDWKADKTIRVDVKSQGFLNGKDARSRCDSDKVDLNQGFDIRYLVVSDDLTCLWHDEIVVPVAANDNKPEMQWWRDKKTMQRFRTPGNHMSGREWSFFCHWLVRAYPDYIIPYREQWVREISSRHIGCSNPSVSSREEETLNKLFKHIYGKLIEANAIDAVDEMVIAA